MIPTRVWGWGLCALLAITGCERFPESTRPLGNLHPNIILISLDTVRADHLPFQGYARATMPQFTALAQESTVFQEAFANSNTTLPSHVTMFTGTLPSTHQIFQPIFDGRREEPRVAELASSLVTLPEVLKGYGYRTVRFASSRDFFLDASIGLGRGFDELHPYGMDSEWTTASIVEWIKKWDGHTRFFAFIHSKRPHAPYTLPASHRNLFGDNYTGPVIDDEQKLRDLIQTEHIHSATQGTLPGIWPESDTFAMLARRDKPQDIQRLRDLYDGALKLTDDYLGEVLSVLRARKMLDNTVLVITSDHGEEFLEHGKLLHDSLHREVLHVPWVVRLPGKSASVVESRVQIADVAPTLVGLLGEKPPASMEGKNVTPLILSRDGRRGWEVHREIFAQKRFWHQVGSASLATAQWKYIEDTTGKRTLYDQVHDREEKNDISNAHPDVVTVMHSQLLSRVKSLQ